MKKRYEVALVKVVLCDGEPMGWDVVADTLNNLHEHYVKTQEPAKEMRRLKSLNASLVDTLYSVKDKATHLIDVINATGATASIACLAEDLANTPIPKSGGQDE